MAAIRVAIFVYSGYPECVNDVIYFRNCVKQTLFSSIIFEWVIAGKAEVV
jgi:hypothetical protein